MLPLNEITWAQVVLIQAGAILQIAALITFIRDTSKPARAINSAREEAADEHEARRKLPAAPAPTHVVHYERELHGVMEETPADIEPGKLAKTAKVNFKQSFKVRRE